MTTAPAGNTDTRDSAAKGESVVNDQPRPTRRQIVAGAAGLVVAGGTRSADAAAIKAAPKGFL